MLIAATEAVSASALETVRLRAGQIAALVQFKLPDGTLKPGDQETVKISVTSQSDAGKARITLIPTGLKFQTIQGQQVKPDAPWKSPPFGTDTGQPKTLEVRLNLTSKGPVIGTRVRNRLTVKLIELTDAEKDTVSDQTRLSWPVQDSVSTYLGNLAEMSEAMKKPMAQLPSKLVQRVEGMPGRWIYKPPVTKLTKKYETRTELREICVRKKRVRVRINGKRRWRTRCVEKGKAEREVKVELPADKILAQRAKDEAKLVAYLKDYVIERGRGLEFSRKRGRYYWLVRRLPSELQNYMTQKRNDAICTGAPLLIKYYRANTSALLKRTQTVYNMRDMAVRLARQRAQDAGAQLIAADKTADELFRTVSRKVLTRKERFSLTSSASVLARLAETRRLVADRRKTPQADNVAPVSAGTLSEISAEADQATTGKVLREKEAAELNALGAIEAVVYAEFIASRYQEIEASLFKPMDKISELHESICKLP